MQKEYIENARLITKPSDKNKIIQLLEGTTQLDKQLAEIEWEDVSVI